MSKCFWTLIWNLSETFRIPLGRFAPYVFHQMIGGEKKVEKVKR